MLIIGGALEEDLIDTYWIIDSEGPMQVDKEYIVTNTASYVARGTVTVNDERRHCFHPRNDPPQY